MKHNWVKYVASAAICFCLMMMAITESSLFLYAALGISVLFIFRPEVPFSAYFISSLSGGYFSVGSLGASRILSLIVIFSLILQWRKLAKFTMPDFLLEFLIVFYSLMSCVLSVTGEMSNFMIMMQSLLVAFLLQKSVKMDTELLIHLIFICSVIAIVMLGGYMMQDSTIMFEERYSGAEGLNTNKFAMMCAQLGAVMIGAFSYMQNKPLKILSLIAFAVSVLIIVISGSRSALIGLLASTLFVVILTQGKGLRKAFLPIVLIAIVGFVLVHYLSSMDSPIIDRFNVEAVTEDGGTGRLGYATRIVNEVISTHPLFGVGMGGQNVMALGIPKQAHNIIIDPLSQLGLVGFVIYLCYIVPIVFRAFRIRKMNSLIIIPLSLFIAGVFNGIGEVVFYEKFFWNSIAMCALIVSQSQALLKHSSTVSLSE